MTLLKHISLVFYLGPLVALRSMSQAPEGPQQIKLESPTIIAIVLDYVADCHKNRAFYEDKGVIQFSVCKGDKANEKRYSLQLFIDDRYEDEPPFQYAHFRNNVVLFDSCGKAPIIKDKEAYFKVLNEEIGDRVYKRPSKKGRWAEYINEKKEPVSGMKEVKYFGNGSTNSVVYIVHEDGTFDKLRTL